MYLIVPYCVDTIKAAFQFKCSLGDLFGEEEAIPRDVGQPHESIALYKYLREILINSREICFQKQGRWLKKDLPQNLWTKSYFIKSKSRAHWIN